MTRIVALFNLKSDADRDAYEAWARSTDLPTVRALPSVDGFSVHPTLSLLGSDDPPPYQYVEIIDVADMERFGQDIASETMQRVAGEFQAFADNPIFMLTGSLD
ncbi:MAG: REDY-like protein HapK [Pseudomonadota bacterium]